MKFIIILLAAFTANIMHVGETISQSVLQDEEVAIGDIIVYVDNIERKKGDIYVGLFNNSKTFRKIKQVYKYAKTDEYSDEAVLIIEDVPFDEYAVVIFQDYNRNQKFDKNFMGIPQEPFGFSTNYIVSTSAPEYKEVTFTHNDEDTELNIGLQIF